MGYIFFSAPTLNLQCMVSLHSTMPFLFEYIQSCPTLLSKRIAWVWQDDHNPQSLPQAHLLCSAHLRIVGNPGPWGGERHRCVRFLVAWRVCAGWEPEETGLVPPGFISLDLSQSSASVCSEILPASSCLWCHDPSQSCLMAITPQTWWMNSIETKCRFSQQRLFLLGECLEPENLPRMKSCDPCLRSPPSSEAYSHPICHLPLG